MSGQQLRVFSLPSLRENSISSEGAQDLARALCSNSTLKSLEYVSGCRAVLPTAPFGPRVTGDYRPSSPCHFTGWRGAALPRSCDKLPAGEVRGDPACPHGPLSMVM